jgi:hypothetical protein
MALVPLARSALALVAALALTVAPAHAQTPPPNNNYVATALSSTVTCTSSFNITAQQAPRPTEMTMYLGSTQPPSQQPPVLTPIIWNQFHGERQQFGYRPTFEANRVGFAHNGRPVIRDRTLSLQILQDDGSWLRVPLFEAVKSSLQQQGFITAASPWKSLYYTDPSQLYDTGPQTEERVAFDSGCNAYTMLNANYSSLRGSFLLHSPDGGHSWAAYLIPNTANTLYTVTMEAPSNGYELHGPPALIVNEKYDVTDVNGTFAHHAWLVLPKLNADGSLSFSGPFQISDHTLCCGSHSGYENQVVSYQDHIHIVYPGDSAVADPISGHLGTPQYAITFSRSQQQFVTAPVLLGVGLVGPMNQTWNSANQVPDSHCQTALAIDAQGYLHVVVAGHGSRMIYRKSLQPDSVSTWSNSEIFTLQPQGSHDYPDEYSYASLVIDYAGQPNVLARWSGGADYHFRLVYMIKEASTNSWKPQQVLLDPGRAYYGEWYQKMSIDPWGRLFINYSYYPGNLFSDEAQAFGSEYGFQMSLASTTCTPTRLTDPSPNYCEYTGYEAVSPSVLMTRAYHESFELATTSTFFEF